MQKSREWHLKSRPSGVLTAANFQLESLPLVEPRAGHVQVRNTWMSVDPYMRPRMDDKPSYVPPYDLHKVLDGGAIGVVINSKDARFTPGDTVVSNKGWREAFNLPADHLRKVHDTTVPAESYLGVLGMPGLTAYVGLMNIIGLKPADVVFISAASGAVGAIACQIAKLKGATVIGSAGGKDKCTYLREIGVDEVIDYKATQDFTAALCKAAPHGIDAYFDNVGGTQLMAAMEAANPFARIALCGMVSQYNGVSDMPGELFNAVRKRLRMEGFIVSDHRDTHGRFIEEMKAWISEGKVTWRQTVEEGIENAPQALIKLFSGANFGKMLVRLTPSAEAQGA